MATKAKTRNIKIYEGEYRKVTRNTYVRQTSLYKLYINYTKLARKRQTSSVCAYWLNETVQGHSFKVVDEKSSKKILKILKRKF